MDTTNATKKIFTRNGEEVVNFKKIREKQPGYIETLAANFLNNIGIERVGNYYTTRVVGVGDVQDCEGNILWPEKVLGRNGFQRVQKFD